MKEKEKILRMFCVGDSIVLLEEGVIIRELQVDEEVLEKELRNKVKNRTEKLTTVQFFRNAVETIIPQYKFAPIGYKYQGQSIHESSYYRKFSEIILETLGAKKEYERNMKGIQAQKEKNRKNRVYWCYVNERGIRLDKKGIKRL